MIQTRLARLCLAFGVIAASIIPMLSAASAAQRGLSRVTREALCVTNGAVTEAPDGRLAIDTPSARAIVSALTPQRAELRFRFLGPSTVSKPLASGELRQQIGIRLRTQDNCNVLFAMWRIAPDSGMVVEVKSNPGMHRYTECGASGYREVVPQTARPVPGLRPGKEYRLAAALKGTKLVVHIDGTVVWSGSVGQAVKGFDGPVGIRTDNARIVFDFLAPIRKARRSTAPGHCRAFVGH